METSHLDQLIQLEENYWWHVAKRKIATNLLKQYVAPPAKVVEGGIGAGGNLFHWKELGYQVAGLDCMPESIQHAHQKGLEPVFKHDLHQPWPIEKESAGAVVLLDVLEHLQDPIVAMRHAAECLDDEGKIIFTVPAYPALFSDWDERLGHYRRYTRSLMRRQAEEAGLQVLRLSHWNSFTLPAAIVLRIARRFSSQSKGTEFPRVSEWVNNALIRAADVEHRASQFVNVPLGLSIVGVLGK